jgi:hypothetical protein
MTKTRNLEPRICTLYHLFNHCSNCKSDADGRPAQDSDIMA